MHFVVRFQTNIKLFIIIEFDSLVLNSNSLTLIYHSIVTRLYP